MNRVTEYHCGVAVIKDKRNLKAAMEKLAAYEDVQEKDTSQMVIWTPAYQSHGSAGDEAESFCPVCSERVIEEEDNYCNKCGAKLIYRDELN